MKSFLTTLPKSHDILINIQRAGATPQQQTTDTNQQQQTSGTQTSEARYV
jgi:hypothetical protein